MRRRDPCRESGSDHCRIREPPTARGAGVPKREGHLYCTLHLDAVQQPEPRTRTHHRFAPRCASDDRMTASAKFPLHAPQQCRNPLVNANSSCLETSHAAHSACGSVFLISNGSGRSRWFGVVRVCYLPLPSSRTFREKLEGRTRHPSSVPSDERPDP